MARIERILTTLSVDGTTKGTAVYEVETVAGRDYPLDPRPISSADSAALAAVMSQAQVAAMATVAVQEAQIATLSAERDTAQAERNTAQADAAAKAQRIADLEAQLAAMQPGATGADEVPFRFGATALLASGWFGPQVTTPDHLTAAVEGFINTLPMSATQKALAIFTWRRSATIRKSNPLVGMVAMALGKTEDDINALFANAKAMEAAELAAQG